jgi:hypothetical protein
LISPPSPSGHPILILAYFEGLLLNGEDKENESYRETTNGIYVRKRTYQKHPEF